MGLREKYDVAIQTCKGKFQGNAEEHDGKLYFKGTVTSDNVKNEIWNAIKTIPDWQKDIVADIQVTGGAAAVARSHTVTAGETLSKIAKEELGNANLYMKIFEANRELLNDPNVITPGQVLRIPAA